MSFGKELVGYLLGDLITPAYFIASFINLLYGACITIMLDVYTRDKESQRTPEPFRWSFFWKDNKLRFLINITIAISIIRFFTDMTGWHLSMFWAWSIGICFDGMIVLYKKLRKIIKGKLANVLKEVGQSGE